MKAFIQSSNLQFAIHFIFFYRNSFNEPSGNSKFKLLIVQCSSGDTNADLIACARYSIQDAFKRSEKTDTNTHVLLIVQLPRVTCHTFTGFQVLFYFLVSFSARF